MGSLEKFVVSYDRENISNKKSGKTDNKSNNNEEEHELEERDRELAEASNSGSVVLSADVRQIPGWEYQPLVLSADLGQIRGQYQPSAILSADSRQRRLGREDPLLVLGSDITENILSYLDAPSLALSNIVSRGWQSVASIDNLWSPKCNELWIGKAHIPRWSQLPGLSKLSSYSLALTDSKRVRIRREDLCDHDWDFHFTKGAPDYWRYLDPYWGIETGPLMRRHFHPDGSQSADPGDKVWGGHESSYSVVTGLLADGGMREHYVRINRWPQLNVSRRLDWGWELSNELFAYSSLPDASKQGGTGPSFSVL